MGSPGTKPHIFLTNSLNPKYRLKSQGNPTAIFNPYYTSKAACNINQNKNTCESRKKPTLKKYENILPPKQTCTWNPQNIVGEQCLPNKLGKNRLAVIDSKENFLRDYKILENELEELKLKKKKQPMNNNF